MTRPPSPGALLDQRLAEDAAAPLLTFYDDATGERAELSAATLATWVAKTSYLLVDDLLAGPGTTVRVALPQHWQTWVWHLACWRTGATLLLGSDSGAADVTVTTAAVAPGADAAGELVVLGLRPFAMPGAAVPPGAVDYDTDVRGHGDRYAGPPPPPSAVLVREGDRQLTWDGLLALADGVEGLGRGERVLTTIDPDTPAGLLAVLAPLVKGGSAVLVRNAADGSWARHVDAESVTALALPAGDDVSGVTSTGARRLPLS